MAGFVASEGLENTRRGWAFFSRPLVQTYPPAEPRTKIHNMNFGDLLSSFFDTFVVASIEKEALLPIIK
jgi:hypothetical protein